MTTLGPWIAFNVTVLYLPTHLALRRVFGAPRRD